MRSCFPSTRTHLFLSLRLSAQFLFRTCTHISLSLRICSVSVQCAHTHLFLSLSASAQVLFSARQRRAELNSVKHIYYVAFFSKFTCKYSQIHSTAIVIILCVFYLIRQRLDYKDFCADQHLGNESWLCLNGSRFNHFFIFIPLSDNRNSKIYK